MEGQQPLSHQLGVSRSAVSSPSGVRDRAPEPSKGFPLFSALSMTSPDTVILLIVDYHAAIGGGGAKPPWPLSLAYAPVQYFVQ